MVQLLEVQPALIESLRIDSGKRDSNFDRFFCRLRIMSHANSAPSIRVFGSGPHHGASAQRSVPVIHHSSISSIPMAIPHMKEAPPPPLPPPRRLALEQGEDLGWKYGNRTSSHASVKPGSSLLGSGHLNKEYTGAWSPPYDYHDTRRGSTVPTVTPIDPSIIMEGLDSSNDDRPILSRYAR